MNDLDLAGDLHALMDRSLANLPVPTQRLHDGAVRSGRRVRRRRRLGTAVGGVVVAAATVAVALPVLGGSTGTDHGGAAVEPTPVPQPFASHPGWWDMPVEEMHDRLDRLLPDRVGVASYEKRNMDAAPGQSRVLHGLFHATLRDTDDVGPGSIEVMLTELPRDARALTGLREQHLSCAGFPDTWELVDPAEGATCEEGGMRAGQPTQRTIAFEDQGVEYREVRRWTSRGEVYAAVSSSVERKWGPPASAVHAPLTTAELLEVATSPIWTTWQSD